MVRLILWNLFLFLLPFLATALWSRWLQRNHPPEKRIRHIAISAAIGTLLVLTSLLVWRVTSGAQPGKHYVPPTLEDGTLVPGHFD